MKKDERFIGGYEITNRELVLRLGFVLDNYKKSWLPRLWKEAEDEALARIPTFKSEELFFQEDFDKGDMFYSFRYYTPESNRIKVVSDRELML